MTNTRERAFDVMADAVLVADDERRYVDANHAATALFGVPREHLLGRRIDDFAQSSPGFDMEASWRQFLETGQQEGLFPLLRPDGSRRMVEYRATANLVPGQHLSVLRDVTERLEREAQFNGLAASRDRLVEQLAAEREALRLTGERLRAILDEMPIGVVVHEPDSGAVLVSNKASAAILGLEVVDPTDPETWRTLDVRRPDGTPIEPEEQSFRRVARTGRPVHNEVVLLRHARTGEDVVVRSSAVQFVDADAPLLLGVFEDVTQEHRLQDERAETLRFAERFIGVLGHDLRNPLNAITMGLGLVKNGGAGAARAIERIGASAERMARMVDQLLDLTRARLAGGIPVETEPGDLATVVSSAVEELAVAHPGRIHSLELPPNLPGLWDPDRLAQVVSNLVGNAIQHGDPSRPITVTVAEQDEGVVTLAVHSEGKPIPEPFLPVLFDPFRRGQRGTATKGAGLGLGLFISREIVRAHGGDVRVTSTAAEGTTFLVTLPRLRATVAARSDIRDLLNEGPERGARSG